MEGFVCGRVCPICVPVVSNGKIPSSYSLEVNKSLHVVVDEVVKVGKEQITGLEKATKVRDLITTIVANRQYLSEIDGLIGDGDHGINMAKGFTGCGTRLDAMGEAAQSLPAALEQLSKALMDDIGGSMGPLYGSFFTGFVRTLQGQPRCLAIRAQQAQLSPR